MKEVGIVRRIDELGRIVIPKEIRRVLAINGGDEIEICAKENYISLSKYHSINPKLAKQFADYLNKLTGETVLVSNLDNFIVGVGKQKDLALQGFSQNIQTIIKKRKFLTLENENNIFQGFLYEKIYCVPIELFGDCFGFIFVLSATNLDKYISALQFFANVMAEIIY
ncbi:MAG: stage V sporulation T C-terminal domain-containing protein [Clostridia bacterium]